MTKVKKSENTKTCQIDTMKLVMFVSASISIFAFVFIYLGFDMNSNTAFAKPVTTDYINKTTIVSAHLVKVWNVISDMNKSSEYRPISNIKNIHKNNSIIERDVDVPAPPFIGTTAHQIITINPSKSVIIENQTEGPITGVKTISLSPIDLSNNNTKTKINVLWTLNLSKIPFFGKGFAKYNIEKSIDTAFRKINLALQQ